MLFHTLLIAHVVLATLALAAGNAALLAPKTLPLHRRAGQAYVAAMLATAAVAELLALLHADLVSIVPALLTFYLVASGARTMARRQLAPNRIDALLVGLAVVAGITGLLLGASAAHGPNGLDKDGFPPGPYYVFAAVALLAAALDVRVYTRRALSAKQRLARHLWRMCFAPLIATTSLFQGQEQVFPKALHGSLLLKLPALLVIAAAIYWAVRVRGKRRLPLLADASRS